jgi:hypothetical protein
MNDDKKSKLSDEAKGAAEKFVQTLGIIDLILGALALYWFRLWYGERLIVLFPSTSYNILDIALITCAAAFVGKAISLLATILMAAMEYAIQYFDHSYYRELKRVLHKYHMSQKYEYSLDNIDTVDMARHYVMTAEPSQRADLESHRTTTILAYSITLLAFLYAVYLISIGGPGLITSGVLVCIILFLILGVAEQYAYIQTLSPRLIALHARELRKPINAREREGL